MRNKWGENEKCYKYWHKYILWLNLVCRLQAWSQDGGGGLWSAGGRQRMKNSHVRRMKMSASSLKYTAKWRATLCNGLPRPKMWDFEKDSRISRIFMKIIEWILNSRRPHCVLAALWVKAQILLAVPDESFCLHFVLLFVNSDKTALVWQKDDLPTEFWFIEQQQLVETSVYLKKNCLHLSCHVFSNKITKNNRHR